MNIPIEDVWLPRCVKQELLNLQCYIFPPEDLNVFLTACGKHGLPEKEAHRLLQDALQFPSTRYVGLALTGSPFSGVAQYCLKRCVAFSFENPRLPIVFIDSEGSFSPALLTRFGTTDSMLENVIVYRVTTVDELLAACHAACGISDCLTIIDSIASIIRHSSPAVIQTTLRCISHLLRGKRSIVVNQTTTELESGELVPCFRRLFERYFSQPHWTHLMLV